MTENKKRITGLDLCKVLGAILVIYYHLVFPYPPDVVSPGFRLGYIPYILSSGMSICVPLFFMSSGALSIRKDVDLRASARQSIHLLFLLVFWSFFSLGLILLMRQEWMGARQFVQIVQDLQPGYIQHLWYMPAYLMLVMMTPALQSIRKGDVRVFGFLSCVVFIFTFGDAFLNDLSGGRYFDAFMAYARTCDEFLTLAREGTPVDIGYDSAFNWVGALMISAVIGLIGGLIMVNSMKNSMTTVKMAVNAQNYVRQNSLHLTAQGDRFLYTQTQRIPRSDGSSGGSRGGSTGHHSSSGRTHGGRSGRF